MDIWTYGYMDIWIYGNMDIWIYGYMDISISKFRREASEDSGRSGVRAPFWPRKHRRVVRNRNSGSLGTRSAFGGSVCACLEPLGPPKMPSGSLWSPKGARNCFRKCLQCRFGAPNALEGLAPEPPVHSKRLLGQAPKLPGRSKSLPEPAPQPHGFQTIVRIVLNSAWA